MAAKKMAAKKRSLRGMVDEDDVAKNLREFHQMRARLSAQEVAHFQDLLKKNVKPGNCKQAIRVYAEMYAQIELTNYHNSMFLGTDAADGAFMRLLDEDAKAFGAVVDSCSLKSKSVSGLHHSRSKRRK